MSRPSWASCCPFFSPLRHFSAEANWLYPNPLGKLRCFFFLSWSLIWLNSEQWLFPNRAKGIIPILLLSSPRRDLEGREMRKKKKNTAVGASPSILKLASGRIWFAKRRLFILYSIQAGTIREIGRKRHLGSRDIQWNGRMNKGRITNYHTRFHLVIT